ncbi:MAG TPA: hypothetical protein VFP67_09285 [Acidimicrobiia bacterium]|nr:hypothetical protein [Acidimicrobiia bacterium]
MNRLNLIGGMAIGASVVYFLDRSQGRRRRRALAHGVRSLADTVSMRSGRLTRKTQAKSRSWEVPMATVNIDIDQGTVTLRGAFPPSDVPRTGGRLHRGARSRDHAEAKPGFPDRV